MRVVYISGQTNVVEVTDGELQKIKGDDGYTPAVNDEINVTGAWDAWLWIRSKKTQINNAGTQLVALAKKL